MAEEPRTIEAYLDALKAELRGTDPALVHDALAGAEEHLRHQLSELGPEGDEAEMMRRATATYGTPREIAEAYLETENRVAKLAAPPAAAASGGILEAVFGVLVDPRAYGALFYLFLSLATGIVYFTWATTGISLSLGLSILIIGLPFTLLFLATVRAISLVEGRIVEGLLGVRMPRRQSFDGTEGTILERIKAWLTDPRTWSTLAYMILQLPLGILYFTLFTVVLSFSLGLIAAPALQIFFDQPIINLYDRQYFLPFWLMPFVMLAGFANLLLGLHLARALGKLHAGIAKNMLVGR